MEILHYERANKNKTIGYADLKIRIEKPTDLIFRKVAHIQSGERKWFALPSFQREVDGQPKYLRYAEFETQAHNGYILSKLEDLVKKFCIENGIEEIPQIDFNTFEKATAADELPF